MSVPTCLAAATLVLSLAACGNGDSDEAAPTTAPTADRPSASASAAPEIDVNATTLPKRDVTPGATFPDATKDAVCAPDYTTAAAQREKVEAMEVYAAYGLDGTKGSPDRKAHMLDRLIPVSLGGNNSLQNVWPQPNAEFEVKESVEAVLRRKVCAGELPLEEAQRALAENWIEAGKTLAQ